MVYEAIFKKIIKNETLKQWSPNYTQAMNIGETRAVFRNQSAMEEM